MRIVIATVGQPSGSLFVAIKLIDMVNERTIVYVQGLFTLLILYKVNIIIITVTDIVHEIYDITLESFLIHT